MHTETPIRQSAATDNMFGIFSFFSLQFVLFLFFICWGCFIIIIIHLSIQGVGWNLDFFLYKVTSDIVFLSFSMRIRISFVEESGRCNGRHTELSRDESTCDVLGQHFSSIACAFFFFYFFTGKIRRPLSPIQEESRPSASASAAHVQDKKLNSTFTHTKASSSFSSSFSCIGVDVPSQRAGLLLSSLIDFLVRSRRANRI